MTCLAVAMVVSLGVTKTWPELGFSSPVISLNNELLPAPFWPIKAMRLLLRTEKLASSKMGLSSKENETSLKRKITLSLAIVIQINPLYSGKISLGIEIDY